MRLVRYSYPNTRYAAPVARSPWAGLESEIDRLFEGTLRSLADLPASGRFPVDLYEDKENTYVRAELPGFKREDIQVELVDGYLTINATRRETVEGRENTATFNRSVTVPDDKVATDRIAAAYEDGVLTVTLPHRAEAKPRKVTVAIK